MDACKIWNYVLIPRPPCPSPPEPKGSCDKLLLVRIPSASASELLIVCTLSPEPTGGFQPNLHRHIIGMEERSAFILVILTWFSRSHQHFQIFNFLQKKTCLHPISWTKWRILAKILCMSSLPESIKRIWSKATEKRWRHHFPIL